MKNIYNKKLDNEENKIINDAILKNNLVSLTILNILDIRVYLHAKKYN